VRGRNADFDINKRVYFSSKYFIMYFKGKISSHKDYLIKQKIKKPKFSNLII
jgi:acid phosphatase class B